MGNASVIRVAFRVDFKLETDDGSLFRSTAEVPKGPSQLRHASHRLLKRRRDGENVSRPIGPEDLVVLVQYLVMVLC